MQMEVLILIQFLLNIISRNRHVDKQVVEESTEKTLKDYKTTIKFLERYDKGQVSEPKILGRHSALRNYIQEL